MRVFMTLLTDSIRLLRARVLFWVALWISAFVALCYLSVSFTPEGISIFFGAFKFKLEMFKAGSELAEMVYLWFFSDILVGWWLSWAAVILALISCAPIFSDFMSEGSIGIPLSKPVSRLSLFFYKYIGSLMFVILQVAIFCVIVFFAIRLRVGTWNFSVFWAVPIVTVMFSYIYSVVVLVSVKTRSMLAALLAGILIWFSVAGLQMSENYFYQRSEPQLVAMLPFGGDEESMKEMKKWYNINHMTMAPLPKTSQTMKLLDRLIVVKGRAGESDKSLIAAATSGKDGESSALKKAATRDSAFYILGTSLAFEAVMLGLAAWIFCRRDY